MFVIIYVVLVCVVQIMAPTYVSLLIAIANIFFPDIVPIIDEVLGIIIVVAKLGDSY